MRLKFVVAGLALGMIGCVWQVSPAQDGARTLLQVKRAPGQKLTYKNLFRMNFSVEKARELGATGGGASTSLSLDVSREWTQEETFKEEKQDTLVASVVTKASDLSMIKGQVTTRELWPWSIEDLKGREMTWQVSPDGQARGFLPAREPERLTLSTLFADLNMLVQTEFYPPLPPGPQGVGDTWTVERSGKVGYEEFQNFDAQTRITSVVKVKGMKKKGNRNCLELEETRQVIYRGWMNTSYNALILEGEGKGKGTWLFDAENGVVVEHQIRLDLEPRPTVVGESSQRSVDTRLTLWVERKLEK